MSATLWRNACVAAECVARRCAKLRRSSWASGAFLESGGFLAFSDTFQDLHGLAQLPGIAVQRLMEDGYGFGAEGDWKTAALVRAMKVMRAHVGSVSVDRGGDA